MVTFQTSKYLIEVDRLSLSDSFDELRKLKKISITSEEIVLKIQESRSESL